MPVEVLLPDVDLTDRSFVIERLIVNREWGTDRTDRWVLTSPTGKQVIAYSEDPEELRKWAKKRKAKRVEIL